MEHVRCDGRGRGIRVMRGEGDGSLSSAWRSASRTAASSVALPTSRSGPASRCFSRRSAGPGSSAPGPFADPDGSRPCPCRSVRTFPLDHPRTRLLSRAGPVRRPGDPGSPRCLRPRALIERLEDSWNWALELSSSGALPWRACLLHRPTWLFLDEATSAVEPALEERLLCPSVTVAKTTLLSIGHRRELALHHDLVSITVSGGLSTSARGSRRGLEQPGV